MKDRIKMIMESQHMTQQTFAQFIQISPASLSSISEAIKAKIPSLSTDWLLFGSGSMYMGDKSASDSGTTDNTSVPKEGLVEFPGASNSSTPTLFDQDVVHGVGATLNNTKKITTKIIDNHQRKIVEIRVFYDDKTWETFVPQKG